jgi:hypothetical protein
MKALILFWLCTTSLLQAEGFGFASITSVTHENSRSLEHHSLSVTIHPWGDSGWSKVSLHIRPHSKHSYKGASLTVYDETGKKSLLRVEMTSDDQIKKNSDGVVVSDGVRVDFSIADELIDGAEIQYQLFADENVQEVHLCEIPRGKLRRLAVPPEPEQFLRGSWSAFGPMWKNDIRAMEPKPKRPLKITAKIDENQWIIYRNGREMVRARYEIQGMIEQDRLIQVVLETADGQQDVKTHFLFERIHDDKFIVLDCGADWESRGLLGHYFRAEQNGAEQVEAPDAE